MFTKFVNLVVNLYYTVSGGVNIAYYNVLYKIHSVCYDEMERLSMKLEREFNEVVQENSELAPVEPAHCCCTYCRRTMSMSEMSILDRSDVDGSY